MAVNTITVDPPGQSSPLVLYSKKPELGPHMCRVQNTQCVPQESSSLVRRGVGGVLYLESGSLRHMRRHIPEEKGVREAREESISLPR
jgi:hypothetical protein